MIEDKIITAWYAFRRAGIEIRPDPDRVQAPDIRTEPVSERERSTSSDCRPRPIFTAPPEGSTGSRAPQSPTSEAASRDPSGRHRRHSAIVAGSAQAVRGDDGNERTVAKLAQGEVRRDVALTGDPRTASAHADQGLVLCEVSKDVASGARREATVAEKMAEIVTLGNKGSTASRPGRDERRAAHRVQAAARNLLGRIRSFFRWESGAREVRALWPDCRHEETSRKARSKVKANDPSPVAGHQYTVRSVPRVDAALTTSAEEKKSLNDFATGLAQGVWIERSRGLSRSRSPVGTWVEDLV